MTTTQYLAALKTLGLTRASKKTAAALGVTVRQCQRYADGENIPETIVLLLRMYLKYGLDSWKDELRAEIAQFVAIAKSRRTA
jgi:hypothetical protein